MADHFLGCAAGETPAPRQCMTARLVGPVVAVEKGHPAVITLPIGGEVQFNQITMKMGLVDVLFNGKWHLAYLDDILDACTPGDVARSAWT